MKTCHWSVAVLVCCVMAASATYTPVVPSHTQYGYSGYSGYPGYSVPYGGHHQEPPHAPYKQETEGFFIGDGTGLLFLLFILPVILLDNAR